MHEFTLNEFAYANIYAYGTNTRFDCVTHADGITTHMFLRKTCQTILSPGGTVLNIGLSGRSFSIDPANQQLNPYVILEELPQHYQTNKWD